MRHTADHYRPLQYQVLSGVAQFEGVAFIVNNWLLSIVESQREHRCYDPWIITSRPSRFSRSSCIMSLAHSSRSDCELAGPNPCSSNRNDSFLVWLTARDRKGGDPRRSTSAPCSRRSPKASPRSWMGMQPVRARHTLQRLWRCRLRRSPVGLVICRLGPAGQAAERGRISEQCLVLLLLSSLAVFAALHFAFVWLPSSPRHFHRRYCVRVDPVVGPEDLGNGIASL
ncbi:hypothetical protein BDW68DRAFT_38669 [Aspergillus falconensis]